MDLSLQSPLHSCMAIIVTGAMELITSGLAPLTVKVVTNVTEPLSSA